jgi:hypothetical protein
MVDEFLVRCNNLPGSGERILRKHIWMAAGHTKPRQFQYWQTRDAQATDGDEKNFGRILSMQPADFVSLLRQKDLLSGKS